MHPVNGYCHLTVSENPVLFAIQFFYPLYKLFVYLLALARISFQPVVVCRTVNLLVRYIVCFNRLSIIFSVFYAKRYYFCSFFLCGFSDRGHIDFSSCGASLLEFFMSIIQLYPPSENGACTNFVFLTNFTYTHLPLQVFFNGLSFSFLAPFCLFRLSS